ncbi:AbgT family transporter [Aeromonas cavernicola]|uniref:Aminobenzoyl-glutamate transporter n=1 Tax=Aeromonas cavernicola TaxID=1006623 RepID=A0A2H9U255_9GAMM|nr:AbgT family transporter [Aeromonas cavernicola]PJG58113.1 aminobenzoyl-glutamate transporter [Aeromonas cavernicola]
MTSTINTKTSILNRTLDKIERLGNKLPHPFMIFLGLMIITVGLSSLLQALDVSVALEKIDHGVISHTIITANSLLDKDGLLFMLSSVLSNFTGFFPLGTVFFMMLGVGIAEGSGLLRTLLSYLVNITPKAMITSMIVFLGIFSNIASAVGYIVLVPLAGLIFLQFGRHPIAGLAAAFAGVSGGWSANILIGATDATFAGISTAAARLIDHQYSVLATSNWYFMIVSTFLITLIGTWVTDKIIEPRLGPYHESDDTRAELAKQEVVALKISSLALLSYLALIVFAYLPESSLLRNPATGGLADSPLMKNLIVLIGLGFAVWGTIFGYVAKQFNSAHDVATAMTQAITQLAGFLVLIFFAAQFIAYFNYSNLGIIFAIKGANALQATGLTGIWLVLGLIILTALLNLLIAVDSAKWAIMAPIFVPMFMLLGLSPELTQVAYRIGDSVTNIIAPTMPLFPLIVAFCQKYNPQLGVGSVVAMMLPYSVAFLVGWTLLLILWFTLGLPLGPDALLHYPH